MIMAVTLAIFGGIVATCVFVSKKKIKNERMNRKSKVIRNLPVDQDTTSGFQSQYTMYSQDKYQGEMTQLNMYADRQSNQIMNTYGNEKGERDADFSINNRLSCDTNVNKKK